MKKGTALLLALGLLLVSACALAGQAQFADAIPQDLRALVEQEFQVGDITDCILLPGTPRGDFFLVLAPWSMNGYLCANGAWTLEAQVRPMQQTAHSHPVFRRHAAGAAPGLQGECGLEYPDGLGFDIIQYSAGNPSVMEELMQFHWTDGDFRVAGWQDAASGQLAVWEDGLWAYYDSETGERLGGARIDRIAEYSLLANFENLPPTLAQARAMEAITRDAAEALFPGWTMGFYEEYNMGHAAAAGYYRVENGLLTIRRVSLSSEASGVKAQTDTMPVPLSGALLARLGAEDAETLLNTSGYGDTFRTADSFDPAKIPVTGTVLQNDLQSHGLLLLTEDADGVRRLLWAEQDGGGYTVRATNPLPKDTYLDLFHFGDGEAGLGWGGEDGSCSFSRTADGSWTLCSANNYGNSFTLYGTLYCGILRDSAQNGTNSILVGAHPWRDMFSADLSTLPKSLEEAAAAMDRNGWAVVNNTATGDLLPLRTAPDAAAEPLGKFYNRTPVKVLSLRDGWARVRIGLDGRLEGWMMTQFLAFGSDMDAVASASPDLTLREGRGSRQLYAAPDMRETTGIFYGSETWIVGVAGDELYILLDSDGNTGYLPQNLFFAGNG
jgi:hypothetical protein